MSIWSKLNNLFRPARLSRRRMALALLVAVGADGLQIPFQIPPAPEIIDVIAMGLTSGLIGFHVLLLPTFVIEFIPLANVLPTWTGCVLAVLALRRREAKQRALAQIEKPPIIQVPPPVPAADEKR